MHGPVLFVTGVVVARIVGLAESSNHAIEKFADGQPARVAQRAVELPRLQPGHFLLHGLFRFAVNRLAPPLAGFVVADIDCANPVAVGPLENRAFAVAAASRVSLFFRRFVAWFRWSSCSLCFAFAGRLVGPRCFGNDLQSQHSP